LYKISFKYLLRARSPYTQFSASTLKGVPLLNNQLEFKMVFTYFESLNISKILHERNEVEEANAIHACV